MRESGENETRFWEVDPGMRVIEGGAKEPLQRGEKVLVASRGREARVICPAFRSHVFRGMVSVDFGDGELDLVEEEQVQRASR